MAHAVRSPGPRAVIHLNITNFAAAVEQKADTRLRGRPVVVVPHTGGRAPVYDMSEEAYRAGIRKSMPLRHALRLCRNASVLPPSPGRYARAMEAVFMEVYRFSPLVESGQADGHFFADLAGTGRLFGSPEDAARRMRVRIREAFGLEPVWASASNKLVAKVATRLVKPAGRYVVEPGREQQFLARIPVSLVPGIEPAELARLREFDLFEAGKVAALTTDDLETLFGSRAGIIYDSVRGIDPSPVRSAGQRPRKISAFSGFGRGITDFEEARRHIYIIAEKLGAELRARGMAAGNLCIAADYADGIRYLRRVKLSPPCWDDISLFEACLGLLDKAWTRRVRMARVCVSCPAPVAPRIQMELFGNKNAAREKRRSLARAVDSIRNRFGSGAVSTALAMGD